MSDAHSPTLAAAPAASPAEGTDLHRRLVALLEQESVREGTFDDLARSILETVAPPADAEEAAYRLGKEEGAADGIQRVAERIGIDSEYRWSSDPERSQPGAVELLERIVEHVAAISSRTPAGAAGDPVGEAAELCHRARMKAYGPPMGDKAAWSELSAAETVLRNALTAQSASRTMDGVAGDLAGEDEPFAYAFEIATEQRSDGTWGSWRKHVERLKPAMNGPSIRYVVPLFPRSFCNGDIGAIDRIDYLERQLAKATRPASPAPAASAGGAFRVGHRVPQHVYEGDTPLFTAATPELAARLVGRLNAALAPAAQVNPGREEIARSEREAIAKLAHDFEQGVYENWTYREFADAILAARPVAEGDAGWQPIETAPKDPEYDVDHGLPGDADEGVGIATRVDSGSPAYLVWWEQTWPGRSKTTYWRPLPEPPAARPAPSPAKGGTVDV